MWMDSCDHHRAESNSNYSAAKVAGASQFRKSESFSNFKRAHLCLFLYISFMHSLVMPHRLLHLSMLLVLSVWCMVPILMVSGHSAILTPSTTVVETPTLAFDLSTPYQTGSTLNGTSMKFHPAFAGAALPPSTRPDGLLFTNLMLPHKDDDITGCSGAWNTTNEFGQPFTNSFILLMIGSCQSVNTYHVAASTGAAGVLVFGCPSQQPYNCEPNILIAFSLIPISTPLPPVISITGANGQQLVQFLKSNLNSTVAPPIDSLQMILKGPGSIVPAERNALISVMQQTTMGSFLGGAAIALPSWSVARFQNLSLDPCTNRPMGMWCEFGHVVMIDVFYYSWTSVTTIPTEFSAFTQLRYFSNVVNSFSGPVPSEWCSLTQLEMFRISQQIGGGITSLPSCIGQSWVALHEFQVDGNSLTSLPDSFSLLNSLKIIRAANNHLQSVPSMVNLTQIKVVDFGSNAITQLPTFSSFATNLLQIGFSNNQITAPIPVTAFNGMSSLQILDLNTNRITGPLPSLVGCSSLLIIDLSSQRDLITNVGGFNSSMPPTWASLITVKELYLQENALISPIYSSSMLSLQKIDLSHNYLTNALPSDAANTNPSKFIDTILTPVMTSLKVSYNLLSGAFDSSSGILISTTLNELYLDHNQLTSSFGFLQSTTPFTAVDLSYNNISDTFPSGSPSSRFVYLNLRGNPFLHVTNLPSWVMIGALTEELGENYGCASLSATPTTAPLLSFRVDPSFWSYQHCQCNQGTFGRPPLCHSVPNAAVLNPHHVITSSEVGAGFSDLVASVRGVGSQLTIATTSNYSRAFSDSMYGENRLTLGMSTVWTIDATTEFADDAELYLNAGYQAPTPLQTYTINTTDETPSSLWTPVRMITVRLHVSANEFSSFEDVISVYEGSSDLKGNRVFTMRGTDAKSTVISTAYTNSPEYLLANNASISQISDPRLYEIQVFSSMASVQFTSRAISGLHFYATYSYDFTCPDGYFYNRDATPNQCHLNYEQYHVGLPIRSAVFVVSSLTIIFIVINIVILALFWSSPVYKAASRVFLAVILVLLLFMGLGSLLYASVPNVNDVGSAICIGRGWLTCLPLTGILGVLLAKTNRLDTIFGATTLQVKKMTDLDIGKTVLLVCSVQIVLLGIYSGLPLSRAQLAVGKGNLDDKLVLSCSQESGFMIWMGIEIAYIACLMLPAAYLGYKTRNLPSQYNESAHIQNAIVLLIFFGIIIVPLDIFIQDAPEAAVLIQGLGQAFMCMMMTAIIFGPKLYYLSATVARGAVGGDAAKTQLGGTNTAMSTSDELTPAATIPRGGGSMKPAGTQPGHANASPQTVPQHRLATASGTLPRTAAGGSGGGAKPLPVAVNPGLQPSAHATPSQSSRHSSTGTATTTSGGTPAIELTSFPVTSTAPTIPSVPAGPPSTASPRPHPHLHPSPISLVDSPSTPELHSIHLRIVDQPTSSPV